jgi:hypothetical protein
MEPTQTFQLRWKPLLAIWINCSLSN